MIEIDTVCANYRPASVRSLERYNLPSPTFDYGELYPAKLGPVLTNFDPSYWVPAAFGLVPPWAREAKIMRSTYNARTETVAEKPSFKHAWRDRQFCIIPAEAFFEPNYESGKPVQWRIERADGLPFGIAGIWERRLRDDGLPKWLMSMLTINADEHPLMRRFHKPGDEKRSIVIIPDTDWNAWLTAPDHDHARAMLQLFDPEDMVALRDPRIMRIPLARDRPVRFKMIGEPNSS